MTDQLASRSRSRWQMSLPLPLLLAARYLRSSEIGMLRAMGAKPSELRRAFFALGTLLGTTGLVLGSVLGTSPPTSPRWCSPPPS